MSGRLLLVEDERIVAAALEHQLKDAGYDIVGNVGRGELAVELALELKPDLALIDINLGRGIDGIEVARRIHTVRSLPVLFLTAYSDGDILDRARELSAAPPLKKPVTADRLVKVIASVLS